jgi:glutaredoxin
MKKNASRWAWLLLFCAAGAQAQLYKWVGPDGKVTYTDTPPPPSATRVETKSLNTGGISTNDFPFELAEAVKNNPVTLYTTTTCAPCDDGRKLLTQRGIPFTEKTVTTGEDAAQFRKLSGADAQLPVLLIGRHKEVGYLDGTWNSALTTAGYPQSSKLPASYRNPVAEAAAPKSVEAKRERPANTERPVAQQTPGELPPATGNAPPGFRF